MHQLEYYKDYHGYLVSNCGRVITPSGNVAKQRTMPKGYRMVTYSPHGKMRGESVHRLVAMLFVPNEMPLFQTQVDHIDGNPANNHADNLRWVTGQENINAKYRMRERLAIRKTKNEEAAQEHMIEHHGKRIGIRRAGEVRIFRSYGEAERQLGLRRKCIHDAIRHRQKTIHGWQIITEQIQRRGPF